MEGIMKKYKDVDSYIGASVPEARPVLEALRGIIKSTVPRVEEGISYGVPFYKYHGAFVGFAVYKNHVSFGFATDALQSKVRQILEEKGYKTAKKTFQIKFGQKVPVEEITQILKVQAKLNEHAR
jgi:uncharacterized protein YdhG (YjbR/CyaY superfamily)